MAGKILIIDSVAANRIILKVKLSGAGYDVVIAASGREGVAAATKERPDLIILDMDMPDLSPETMMDHFRTVASLQNVLVIMLSGNGSSETRLRAYRAGCDEFFPKPYVEPILLARIRRFFREDDQLRALSFPSGAQYSHDIASGGFYEDPQLFLPMVTIVVIGEGEAALKLKRKLPQDDTTTIVTLTAHEMASGLGLPFHTADAVVVVSDTANPNATLHLISALRSRNQTRDARFCVQFEEGHGITDQDIVFDFGADAILHADDAPEEVALRLRALVLRKHRADKMRERIKLGLKNAILDPLTNIPNRHYMRDVLRSFIGKAQQSGGSVAVIICDVDRFKSVNDQFGHIVGDAVLSKLASRMKVVLREDDLIARFGGEEFLIALPNATIEKARAVAERLMDAIRKKPFRVHNAPPLLITISAGLALVHPNSDTPIDTVFASTIEEADQAMLLSKARGRNKITYGRSAA